MIAPCPHPSPHSRPHWPRPPHCLRAADLALPPGGAWVAVAGIVICRQRPGTAKGVIFVTLEDETGTANIVVWARMFERYRRAVIAGRCLRVTGRLQREGDVVHVVAERIEDISALLDEIVGIAPPSREEVFSRPGSRRIAPPDVPEAAVRPASAPPAAPPRSPE